jgi:hypothetical protein
VDENEKDDAEERKKQVEDEIVGKYSGKRATTINMRQE